MKLVVPLLTLGLFTIISSLMIGPPVSAQEATGISIAPLRQEGEIDPGFVYSSSLIIKNTGMQTQRMKLSAETFSVINQSYDYLFKTDTLESNWVTFDHSSLLLSPGETVTVPYQVSVPIGTEPGGYYLALLALNQPSSTSLTGITSTERVASLLYLTVSGQATRSGQLINLRGPIVMFNKTNWSATLQNSGTLHYRSHYSAEVDSVLNYQLSFHEDSRLILPSTVRLIEDPVQPPELLGLYTITYTVSLGDNPSHQETHLFLYLPPLQIILIALIIAVLVFIKRQYKQRIV